MGRSELRLADLSPDPVEFRFDAEVLGDLSVGQGHEEEGEEEGQQAEDGVHVGRVR